MMGRKLGKGNTSVEEVIVQRRIAASQAQSANLKAFDNSDPYTWPNANPTKLPTPLLANRAEQLTA